LNGVDLLRSINHGSRGYPVPMVPAAFNASSIEPWRSRMAPVAALADWQLTADADAADSHAALRHADLMDPYERGRQSLRRLYEYAAATSSPPLAQADAIVQLADWDLLHSRNGHALDTYAQAYSELEAAGVPAEAIAQLFAPPLPVVLPAFKPNPLAADEAKVATGHIDVAFEVTKYGRTRAVEIRDVANATPDDANRLVALLARNRFRPLATAGQFADASPVVLRYHLYD
jgi:hypothetical protein